MHHIDWNSHLTMLITVICFGIGLLGTLLPVLPGVALVWAGVVFHKLMLGSESVSWLFVAVTTGLMLFALATDLLCTFWGAKRYGASWKGGLGAGMGGMLGLILFSLPGAILGSFLGAMLFEYIDTNQPRTSVRAGIGAVVGGFVAVLIKGTVAVGIIVAFFIALPSTPPVLLEHVGCGEMDGVSNHLAQRVEFTHSPRHELAGMPIIATVQE